MARTGRRTDVLELAVLGVLHEAPMHGYQVRKLLNGRLGTFRALSYGTLYPTLKGLVAKGWIRESATDDAACDAPLPDAPLAGALTGRRGRIVYEITAEGKEHFQNLVTDAGPQTWEDDTFDVHFAFFARTDAGTRLRILEGRRMRLQERREAARVAMQRTRERRDAYTQALARHGLEAVEREVRWLDELIDSERAGNMTHLIEPPA
ncbi:MAG: PadR family transcriptional regulator [Kineosporiaceae bacterium]|nr:PadR family transcriptional regulator [Kineosporiaceae bacterium]MBK7623362.1 PadR family transcriptional regulator [Kineosporiaceae bacterium]MBK8074091.1 PadR family transcriptional regulator [Kineosporiaceae bacterium]